MHCSQVTELLSAYIDRELDAGGAASVAVHLAGCPRCTEEYEALREVARVLSSAPQVPVPRGFRADLMQRVRELEANRQASAPVVALPVKRSRVVVWRGASRWAVAAALLAALGAGSFFALPNSAPRVAGLPAGDNQTNGVSTVPVTGPVARRTVEDLTGQETVAGNGAGNGGAPAASGMEITGGQTNAVAPGINGGATNGATAGGAAPGSGGTGGGSAAPAATTADGPAGNGSPNNTGNAQPPANRFGVAAAPAPDESPFLVRNAELKLQVKHLSSAMQAADQAAIAAGGRIEANVSTYAGPDGRAGARLTLVVPAARREAVLHDLASLGVTLRNEPVLTDIANQVSQAEANVAALRAQLAAAGAADRERLAAQLKQAEALHSKLLQELQWSRIDLDLEEVAIR